MERAVTRGLRKVWEQIAAGRFRFRLLLASLVILILACPLALSSQWEEIFLTGLITLVLIAAVYAASRRRVARRTTVVLALCWLYLAWFGPAWLARNADLAADFVLLLLLALVLSVILRRLRRLDSVDSDAIAGALSAYLLLGVMWTSVYSMIEALSPGAFSVAPGPHEEVWIQLLYFSFKTLSTLGYGDIVPLSATARMWSAMEAVTGVLFVAVLIARLVTVYRH